MKRDDRAQYYWNEISKDYDRLYVSHFNRGEDRQTKEWLAEASRFRTRLRILDIGCGTGLGLSLLPQAIEQIEYTGMDISEGMISRFRSKAHALPPNINVELLVGDARWMTRLFSPGSFDLVMSINAAASYIGRPTQLMRNARVLLSDNGVLFASFLNRRALRRVFYRRHPIERYNTRGADEGLRGVSAVTVAHEELERRCRRAGLRLAWVRYQSVLGGVWEHDLAASLEPILIQGAPRLGHTINMLAYRPATGAPAE